VNEMERLTNFKALDEFRSSLKKPGEKAEIIVGLGTCGEAQGGNEVVQALKDALAEQGRSDQVIVRTTGCLGFCEIEPIVIVRLKGPPGFLYHKVKPRDAVDIISETIENGKCVEGLQYVDSGSGTRCTYENEIPFYNKQVRNLLGNNVEIDPKRITDYIRLGGYSALKKALSSMKPDEIINEVKRSGLRGRGGGGFQTGRKWATAGKFEAKRKFIICNADEGDPGAYMDRNLLESNPHSVIEGMIVGAYAVGSNEGYIYLRAEYPLAIKHFSMALEQCREHGLLGEDILGSGFNFDIKIYKGGGAFVCGESSALIQSIEGKVGEPRAKHIHATEHGLWGYPTVLNNVETWANISLIINEGAEWFAEIGTEGSKGTKIFSLVGKINNTGLVEVPMGMTIREIVFDIGGGTPEGRKFKAIQTGGPSGGCVPAELMSLPIDFDELKKVGSMMGSGGMIVMDEDTCMVDVAKYFTEFNCDESCGKCTSCREGTGQMLEILKDITNGRGTMDSIALLEELGEHIKEISLCGLGKTAPNPVLTTLKYFREEYLAHINEDRCPARVCKALITLHIDPEKCTGCTLCAKKCPVGAISGEKKEPHSIDMDTCTKCRACYEACNFNAIDIKTGGE